MSDEGMVVGKSGYTMLYGSKDTKSHNIFPPPNARVKFQFLCLLFNSPQTIVLSLSFKSCLKYFLYRYIMQQLYVYPEIQEF